MSYSSFEYSGIELSQNTLIKESPITASVTVKNVSDVPGKEIVQLYIRDLVGSISRPIKELKGFEKIILEGNGQMKVTFEITEELLRFYNAELNHVSEPGTFEVFIGPNSRDLQKKSFELK